MGFIIGLDLGQKQDFSAMTVAEWPHWDRRRGWVYPSGMAPDEVKRELARMRRPTRDETDWPLNIVHLERWLRGTPYPTVVADVTRLYTALNMGGAVPTHLIVDATGVGAPVMDLLHREGLPALACTITGGKDVNWTGKFEATVPKRDLVMSAVVLLETDRLRWPNRGENVQILERELRDFQMKYSKTGHEMFEAERQEHDDLVLSLSMATWTLSLPGQYSPFYVRPPATSRQM